MSTVHVRSSIEAIHMRVVYFADAERETPEEAHNPILPADLARVFRQLDRLVEYAELIAPSPLRRTAPPHSRPGEGHPLWEALAKADFTDEAAKHDLWYAIAETDLASLQDTIRKAADAAVAEYATELKKRLGVAAEVAIPHVTPYPSFERTAVSVISLRMGSPLEAILEIPMATWSALGFGLFALADRIANTPVRIARKRKEELLKTAIIDRQIQLVADGRADALALLLLREGPQSERWTMRSPAPTRQPDEITFLDPADPDDS